MKVAVIGGGIVGSLLAYELSKYDLELILIEKNNDFGQEVTKANSAIIHGGYDDPPGSLRAELCSDGNRKYDILSKELSLPVKRIGSLVVSDDTSDSEKRLEELYRRGIKNGVEGLSILSSDKLQSIEPNLDEKYSKALYCKSAAITEPWMVAVLAAKGAEKNGARLITGDEVVDSISKGRNIKKVVLSSGEEIEVNLVLNAAGVYFNKVARIFGVRTPEIILVKGQYLLLDHLASELVSTIIFPLPSKKGKGKLIVPTIDGGILLGPTSEAIDGFNPEELSTTSKGIKEVADAGEEFIHGIARPKWFIKTFAGLRPETPNKDFYIKLSSEKTNFITVGGMRSPGLTAAPAVADYVIEYLIQEKMGITLVKNDRVRSISPGLRIKELSFEDASKKIEENSSYGRIICQCNQVSEKEIRDAIRDGARTLDDVKFRTRATFGRCQGGFCTWKIMKIISEELNIPLEEVKKNDKGSELLDGKVRK
ncbi:MAG: NAD(P)/FAD-dependent oxidoreductase [Thermotogota bacterium]|nr:NAD(P)/FAD-dependent oxidoreductase [Thermotogota bacterium]